MNKGFSMSFIRCSGFALANLLYFLGMILLNRADKRVNLIHFELAYLGRELKRGG